MNTSLHGPSLKRDEIFLENLDDKVAGVAGVVAKQESVYRDPQ